MVLTNRVSKPSKCLSYCPEPCPHQAQVLPFPVPAVHWWISAFIVPVLKCPSDRVDDNMADGAGGVINLRVVVGDHLRIDRPFSQLEDIRCQELLEDHPRPMPVNVRWCCWKAVNSGEESTRVRVILPLTFNFAARNSKGSVGFMKNTSFDVRP